MTPPPSFFPNLMSNISWFHTYFYKTPPTQNLCFWKLHRKKIPPPRSFFFPSRIASHSSVGHHNGPTNTDRLLENQQRQENPTGCWFSGGGFHIYFSTALGFGPKKDNLFVFVFFPTQQQYPKPKVFPKCGIFLGVDFWTKFFHPKFSEKSWSSITWETGSPPRKRLLHTWNSKQPVFYGCLVKQPFSM